MHLLDESMLKVNIYFKGFYFKRGLQMFYEK